MPDGWLQPAAAATAWPPPPPPTLTSPPTACQLVGASLTTSDLPPEPGPTEPGLRTFAAPPASTQAKFKMINIHLCEVTLVHLETRQNLQGGANTRGRGQHQQGGTNTNRAGPAPTGWDQHQWGGTSTNRAGPTQQGGATHKRAAPIGQGQRQQGGANINRAGPKQSYLLRFRPKCGPDRIQERPRASAGPAAGLWRILSS